MTVAPAPDPSSRPNRVPWPAILLAGAFIGPWLMARAYPLSWPGLDDLAARAVGVGLGVAGLALMGWGAFTLAKHRTTVLPHGSATHLVTDGPFAFRRNPIYLGEVLVLLGAAEVTKNIWFVVFALVFAVLVTWLAILPEERHLEARFGQAYLDYKARVRRWI